MATRKNSRSAPPPAASAASSLQEEIDMLRSWMRMIEKLANEGKPLGEMLKMLDMLGKSSTRLAGLLRAEKELCGEKEFGSVFNQALSEVIRELGMNEAEGRK